MIEDPAVKTLEDEASSETLVCRVLSALQNLSEQLETSQVCFFAEHLVIFFCSDGKSIFSFSLTV